MIKSLKIKLILSHLIVFVLGIATPIGIYMISSGGEHYHAHTRDPKGMEAWVCNYMTTRLSLTADQVTQIKPIIHQSVQQMDQLNKDSSTKANAVLDDTDAQIEKLLTPAQQAEFTKMTTERKHSFHHEHGF